MVAFFVAACVITLMQLFRTRERRLLPLCVLFAFLALAHSRGDGSAWNKWFHIAAGGSGLVLLVALSRGVPPPRNERRR